MDFILLVLSGYAVYMIGHRRGYRMAVVDMKRRRANNNSRRNQFHHVSGRFGEKVDPSIQRGTVWLDKKCSRLGN